MSSVKSVQNGDCYFSHTGIAAYDQVGFSAPVAAARLGALKRGIAMVEHLGSASMRGMMRNHTLNTDNDVLMLTQSNGGEVAYYGDGRPKRRPLRKGNFSFVPAGFDGYNEFPGSNCVLVVYFPHGQLNRLTEPLGKGPLPLACSKSEPRIADLLQLLRSQIANPGAASDVLIDGITQSLAALVAGHSLQDVAEKADRIHISPVRLARVLEFIESRLHDDISLADLAAQAQLSAYHFSRVFKNATGVSPYHYVGQRRIERAAALLEQREMPLAQLALATGYSSQAHFTAAFSKAKGMPPGRYRRLMSRP